MRDTHTSLKDCDSTLPAWSPCHAAPNWFVETTGKPGRRLSGNAAGYQRESPTLFCFDFLPLCFLENHTPAQQVHDSGLPPGLYLMLNRIPQQRSGHFFEMSHLPASSGGGTRGTTIFLSSLFWRNSCFPRQLVNFFLNLKKITSNKNGAKNEKVGALRPNKLCSFSI